MSEREQPDPGDGVGECFECGGPISPEAGCPPCGLPPLAMSYMTDDERAAIPADMLQGPPVTIANASQTHWPKEDMIIGGYFYYYVKASDELVRYDVLHWVDARRWNQKMEATK